ncbi:MAG: DUF493 family protein [Chloroherpetonaceae bacterium]
MNTPSFEKLQIQLDKLDYPTAFMFKFIAPLAGLIQLRSIFEGYPVRVNPSRNGNYISITAELEMQSSVEIIAIYEQAAKVEGVILL